MTREYLAEFRSMFEELQQHPAFEVITAEILKEQKTELAAYTVRILNRDYNFDIEDYFKDYIEVSLNTHLRYVYYIDGKVANGGEFHLSPMADTLISTRDPQLWLKDMPQEEIEFIKRFRIFDDHPDAGDFKMGAFYMTPGVCPPAFPDIYFYDRGEYWKMNLDYGGYLDALLGLFGVSNWQYIFCDIDMNQIEHESLYDELNTTLTQLGQLFPDRDFEPYREMLSKKKNRGPANS